MRFYQFQDTMRDQVQDPTSYLWSGFDVIGFISLVAIVYQIAKVLS